MVPMPSIDIEHFANGARGVEESYLGVQKTDLDDPPAPMEFRTHETIK